MSHRRLTQLFEHASQYTPYLKGYDKRPDHGVGIHIAQNNTAVIQPLFHDIKSGAPEAGSAYWLTRTWDLLCWQPLALSLIAIHELKALPDVQHVHQWVHTPLISGFYFESAQFEQGSVPILIQKAGQQLQILFEAYRSEMDQWVRIRPGFTRHLWADNLLNGLLLLQKTQLDFGSEQWMEYAKLWLDACQLPQKYLDNLTLVSQRNELQLTRTSCCLVYKCAGREMCADCPRQRNKNSLLATS